MKFERNGDSRRRWDQSLRAHHRRGRARCRAARVLVRRVRRARIAPPGDPLRSARARAVSPISLVQVSFDKDVADLEALVAALDLPSVSLTGWSYCGGVVARYAMLHPERVSRLVMVGTLRCAGGEFLQAVQAEQTARLNAVAGPFMEELRKGLPFTPEVMRRSWDAFVQTRCS